MHGVPRNQNYTTSTTSQIEEYLNLNEEVLRLKSCGNYSKSAFTKTTEVLGANPDFYTVWNYRREILSTGVLPSLDSVDVLTILTSELQFTMSLLKKHPKTYWIWNHRRWCLENLSSSKNSSVNHAVSEIWRSELNVVETMLDRDPRNFHAWSYRRYVLKAHPVPENTREDLLYTQRKIENNFSNFSAWHQRSKILVSSQNDERLWRDKEFAFVESALWTDPTDQSAWIYHRWLVSHELTLDVLLREIKLLEELLLEEPDSKWCLETLSFYLSKLVSLENFKEDDLRLKTRSKTILQRLQHIDPLRKGRYIDLASKV